MLRIRKCTLLTIQNTRKTSVLNYGMKTGFKEILAKKMKVFDGFEDSIQLKKVSFDLGEFSASEYDSAFFIRLEALCDEFVQQLMDTYKKKKISVISSKQLIEESAKRKSTNIEAIETIELTRIQKVLNLIEETKSSLSFDSIHKVYQDTYSIKMSKITKNTLVKLLRNSTDSVKHNTISLKAKETKTSIETSNLLLLLENENLNGNWIKRILQNYQKTYDEKLPQYLKNTLKDFQLIEKNRVKIEENNSNVLSNTNTLIDEPLIEFIKKLNQDNETKKLIDIIYQSKGKLFSDSWFEFILKAYKNHYKKAVPLAIQMILLQFSKTKISTKKSVFNKNEENQSLGKNNVKKAVATQVELQKVKLKTLLEAHIENTVGPIKPKEFVDKEVMHQLLGVLNDLQLTDANWIQQLLNAYKDQFGERVSTKIQQILKKFESEILQKDTNSNAQKAVVTQIQLQKNKLKTLLEAHLTNTIAPIKPKGFVDREVVNQLLSVLNDLQSTDANWLKELLKAYKHQFGERVSKDIQQILKKFENESLQKGIGSNVQKAVATQIELQKVKLKRLLEAHIENSVNIIKPKEFVDKEIMLQLLSVLNTLQPIDANWIQQLLNAYKDQFGERVSKNIQQILKKFESEILQKESESNVQIAVATQIQLQKVKLKRLLEAHVSNTIDPIKPKAIVGEKAIEQLLSVLNTLQPIDANWLKQLLKAYKDQFGERVSTEVQQFLKKFKSEILQKDLENKVEERSINHQVKLQKVKLKRLLEAHIENTVGPIKPKEFVDKEIVNHLLSVLNDLQSTDANWIQQFLNAYKHQFGERVSTKVQQFLKKFESEILQKESESNVQIAVATQFELQKVKLKRLLEAHIENTVNTIKPKEFVDKEVVNQLLSVLNDLELTDANWIQQLLKAYKHQFGERVSKNIQQLLKEFEKEILQKDIGSNVQKAVASQIELQKVKLKTLLEAHIENSVNIIKPKEFVDKKIMLQLLSVLNDLELTDANWIQQLLKAYKHQFGERVSKNIQQILKKFENESLQKDIGSSVQKAVASQIELQKVKLKRLLEAHIENSVNIIKPKEFVDKEVMHQLLSVLNDLQLTDANWIQQLLNAYKHQFGERVSTKIQQILKKFESEILQKDIGSNAQKAVPIQVERQKSKLKTLLEAHIENTVDITNSKRLEYQTIIRQLLSVLNDLELTDANWIQQLLKAYKHQFGGRVSKDIQQILKNFEKEILQKENENKAEGKVASQIQLQKVKLKTLLEAHIENTVDITNSKRLEYQTIIRQLLSVLNDLELTDANWIQQLLKAYKHQFGERVSKEVQQFLKEFEKEILQKESESNVQIAVATQIELQKVKLKTLLEAHIENTVGPIKPKEFVDKEVMHQLLSVLNNLQSTDANWIQQLLKAYKHQFGERISKEIQQFLKEFEKESLNIAEIRINEKQQPLKKSQKIKLKVNETFSISKKLIHFLSSLTENNDTQKLIDLVKGLENRLEKKNWFEIVLKEYQLAYDTNLPLVNQQQLLLFAKKITQENIEPLNTEQFKVKLKKALLKDVTKHHETKKYKKKELLRKTSYNAELLKLKEGLKMVAKKLSINDLVIVENAGIICGWVLWKRFFNKFGWLNEGHFYTKDGHNTAIIAANWLHRLGGRYSENPNLLIASICNLTEEEYFLYSDKALQEFMGTDNLEDTIQLYYEELLSMWPIFKQEEKQLFIDLFLQREGVFVNTPIGWELIMVKEPYDQLMIKTPIPWPLNFIRFSWSTYKTGEVKW